MHSVSESNIKKNANIKITPKMITGIGVLSAVSFILYLFPHFPLPFMPFFLKVDFSNLPIVIGTFAYGPIAGVFISLVKCILHGFVSTSGGIGEVADFLISGTMSVVIGLIYMKKKTRKNAIFAMAMGAVAMAIVGCVANKYLLLPVFSKMMPIEQIFQKCSESNFFIHDVNSYIVFGVLPFNIFKAVISFIPALFVYKPISKILTRTK